jgi:hypothetical protein
MMFCKHLMWWNVWQGEGGLYYRFIIIIILFYFYADKFNNAKHI